MIYKTICIYDINDNHFDEVSKLIFNEYFILGNSIPNISLRYKIQIRKILDKNEKIFLNLYFIIHLGKYF